VLQSWRVVGEFNGSIRRYLISWGFIAFAYFGIQAVALNLYFVRLGLSVEQIGLLQGS
jgi:hypothetical protein